MIERVARAIYETRPCTGGTGFPRDWPEFKTATWDDLISWDFALVPQYREEACAAIAAMREPTQAMEVAAEDIEMSGDIWRAMIDELLKSEAKP
jgi:hypothetical protein